MNVTELIPENKSYHNGVGFSIKYQHSKRPINEEINHIYRFGIIFNGVCQTSRPTLATLQTKKT